MSLRRNLPSGKAITWESLCTLEPRLLALEGRARAERRELLPFDTDYDWREWENLKRDLDRPISRAAFLAAG